MMEKDNRAIDVFDELAHVYVDKYMDVSKYSKGFNAFLDLVPKKGKLLELACGPGNATAYVFNERPDLQIHATDSSQNMLDLAQKSLPDVSFEKLDCRDLEQTQGAYDGLIMAFGLPYLNQKEVVSLAEGVALKVKEAGVVYLSWIEDNQDKSEERKSSSGTHSLFMYFYLKEDLKAIFKEHGFEEVYSETVPIEDSKGSFPRDGAIVFKKHK